MLERLQSFFYMDLFLHERMTMVAVAVNLVLMHLLTLVTWHARESEVLAASVYHRIDLVLLDKVVVKIVLNPLSNLLWFVLVSVICDAKNWLHMG